MASVEQRIENIRTSAWSARARATSATGWMMRYTLDVAFLLEQLEEARAGGRDAALKAIEKAILDAQDSQ